MIGLQDLLTRAGRDEVALIKQHQSVACSSCQVEVMEHDHGGGVNGFDEVEQGELMADVEVIGGLVEQQMAGLLGDGSGDENPLTFPAGQLGDKSIRETCQVRSRQGIVDDVTIGRIPVSHEGSVGESSQGDGVANRQRQGLIGNLRDDGDLARNLAAIHG